MTDSDAARNKAIEAMNSGSHYFDVTIICTTDDFQAEYWMDRLKIILPKEAIILAVSEDWGGSGAGNGLGTLYAFEKACKLAKSKYDMDLNAQLKDKKVSAALFHTAGKGTRLAPLPASENNNKPGVKLPFGYTVNGKSEPLTVLEAVVLQSGIYGSSRKGRLSVFWGDQVFIPSAPFGMEPTHHIDILCTLLGDTAPTADEWASQGLDKYGVIACIEKDGRTDAAQVEKVSHATATEMLGKLGKILSVGPSLGSFSVSADILLALCEEFRKELDEKTDKLDTDPHFWMPLTLAVDSYIQLMEQKGTAPEASARHHERMQNFINKFPMGNLGLFGAVNVGKDACWWDYGQLKLYSRNSLLLLEDSDSAQLLKKFLKLKDDTVVDSDCKASVDNAYVFCSKIGGGSLKDSTIARVTATEVNAEGAIIVNCAAKKITAGKGAILYNLIQDEIIAEEGKVMVSVTNESGESMLLQSQMDIDGGKAWKLKLNMNEMSFEDVHSKNKSANIVEIAKKREEKYQAMASSL